MKNFVSLKILDKFRFLYEKLDINYNAMRLILNVKLTSDTRRTFTALNNVNVEENSNNFKKALLVYLIVGFFMMFNILLTKNVLIAMLVHFSTLLFFILTTSLADFSSVMLDTKDKEIIGTKGVSLKTLNAAKLTHIMIYILNLNIVLNGFSLLASIKYGVVFFILFFIEIILLNLLSIVLSGLVYLIVLKLFDGEKLKDAINIIQIFITIILSGIYFISSNLFESINTITNFDFGALNYILIPYWFAAPFEIIKTGNKDTTLLILSFLSIVVPLISTYIYIQLSPIFEKQIQKLNNESSIIKKNKLNLSQIIGNFICTKDEKIFFNLISSILKKDRDIKLRLYPTIGVYCFFPLYIFFNESFKHLGYYLFMGLYFCLIIIPYIIDNLKYSKDYKASYVYTISNTNNTTIVRKASFKACLVNIIIPIYLIECLFFTYFYKYNAILNLTVIFLVLIFITIKSFKLLKISMPFSVPFEPTKKNNYNTLFYLIIILIFIMAGIHALITFLGSIFINIYILILLLLDIVLYKITFK